MLKCMNPRLTLVAVILAGACLSSLVTAAAPVPSSSQQQRLVTLEQDALLEAALAALQRSAGGAVVAEIPTLERRHAEGLKDAPVPRAAEEISKWYQLYRVSRPGSIAFQRR
jgi:hypothetical protein